MIQGCATKIEYIYVQPECNVVPRKTLPEIDAGVLWDVLTLPQRVLQENAPELITELPEGYDGYNMYDQLERREKLIVDLLTENEAIVKELCEGNNG